MYNSQYYTCEEIDQRLLQGYFDDAVAAGYVGTQAQFLEGIIKALNYVANPYVNTIADDTITTSMIKDKQVTGDKIADDTITGDKIAASTITARNIKDGNIGEGELDDEAVSTSKIQDGAITKDKIADDSIDDSKLQMGSVTYLQLSDGMNYPTEFIYLNTEAEYEAAKKDPDALYFILEE